MSLYKLKKNPEFLQRLNNIRATIPMIVALTLFATSAAYIIFRTLDNRAYAEKWKDYDECGLS